jgi:predicted amidohydrolase
MKKNVTVISFSFSAGEGGARPGEEGILKLIDRELHDDEDIVLLPESCTGSKAYYDNDPFIKNISKLAEKHKAYIVCPLNRVIIGNKSAVSAYLFDRKGEIVFCYDKMYPFWKENDKEIEAVPGKKAVYADTDFGRVSIAICFDANFPDLWREISDVDTDMVIFVSAYSAGSQLKAHALNHHFNIVTATQVPDFAVIDIAGREIKYEKGDKEEILINRANINLNKAICHYNFNRDKIDRLLKDYRGKIKIDSDFPREEWIILASEDEQLDLKQIMRKYNIEPLRGYKRRSERFINQIREKEN